MVALYIDLKYCLKRFIKCTTVFYCSQAVIFKGPLLSGGSLLSSGPLLSRFKTDKKLTSFSGRPLLSEFCGTLSSAHSAYSLIGEMFNAVENVARNFGNLCRV